MDRVEPPHAADERTMLVAFLDYYRETMIRKLEGLNPEQARWKPADTATSLISMVQHLAVVENWWFRVCFDGQPDDYIAPDDDPDADFRVPDDRTIDDVVAFYRREYALANDIIERASSLDDWSPPAERPKHPRTLRWILVHMIEETARHAGHADITRELIDGSTGD
jgi:uncharacterized damage-inducible protein DinB